MLLFQMMVAEENPYESVSSSLGTGFIGRRIIYFPRLSSTMDTARQQVRKGAAEGTVVVAGEQTGGRGRGKRIWLSPPGNIALSVILYPDIASLPYLIMIASLAMAHGIEETTGLKADIKWPNDVLIGGKKVGGILIENEISGGKTARAVIGIGINIALEETAIENSTLPATSLEKEIKQRVSKGDLTRSLLAEMERLYLLLPDGGLIFGAWRDKLVTLGKRVTVAMNDKVLEGIAESVDESGSLALRLDDGECIRIVAGDVTLREQ
jgi:BirA family biotin operon repressor/biotin-[acetyl-CoA-carboxylase] ligase